MSSVSLYMYNSLAAEEPAVAAVFREIQAVEQRHLEIFHTVCNAAWGKPAAVDAAGPEKGILDAWL